MARRATSTLSDSTGPDRPTRPGRRMPAVSTMRKSRLCQRITESTASRVVPGISLTSIRCSCSNRLTSDDLPAFGRPTIATPISFGGASRAAVVLGLFLGARPCRSAARSRRAGRRRRCRARPRPRTADRSPARRTAARASRAFFTSILLTTARIGLFGRAKRRDDVEIAGDEPLLAVEDEHEQVRLARSRGVRSRRPAAGGDLRSRRTCRRYRAGESPRPARRSAAR